MTVIFNCSLDKISYYKTGGKCAMLYAPNTVEELASYLKQNTSAGRKYFVLGAGSNSLVLDDYWDGAVFSLQNMKSIQQISPNQVSCEAGNDNLTFVKFATDNQLSGAEWMHGLPGQIGGTTRMNARCYGGEISQIATTVYTVTQHGEQKSYQASECFRGYKDTVFMGNNEIIWKVDFTLDAEKSVDIGLMKQCIEDRTNKGQYLYPSCGCVFKNNYAIGRSSGALLEEIGAKNFSLGNAQVSPQHANFIYNKGATSSDILSLSLKMREQVWQKLGYWLEYEMEVLGNLPQEIKQKIEETRS